MALKKRFSNVITLSYLIVFGKKIIFRAQVEANSNVLSFQ